MAFPFFYATKRNINVIYYWWYNVYIAHIIVIRRYEKYDS